MCRIVCKLNPYTLGGVVYYRKQYKKARYRKKEHRQWVKLDKALKECFGEMERWKDRGQV